MSLKLLNQLRSLFDTAFTPLCLILWILLFSHQSGFLFISKNDVGNVISTDDDAGTAVETAINTKLWNDNKFLPYGPVYFRLTHILANFIESPSMEKDQTLNQNRERNHHYTLMFISLLSLHLIGFFFCSLIFKTLGLKILSTLLLVSSFLQNPDMARLVIKAHPDWLFVLILLLALHTTFKLFHFPENRKYYFSAAFLWGTAFSTKLTSVLFIPFLLLVWPQPFTSKKYFLNVFKFFSLMLGSYFLVGFPQNFNFIKVINYLRFQSAYSTTVDLDFLKVWGNLFFDQFGLPLLVLLILFLQPLENEDKPPLPLKKTLQFFSLLLIPVGLLLAQRIITSYHHYPFPFGMSLLLGLTLISLSLRDKLNWRMKPTRSYQAIFLMTLFMTFKIAFPPVPKHFVTYSKDYLYCKDDMKLIADKVNSHLRAGERVLLDPNIPYNHKWYYLRNRSYHKTIDFIRQGRPTLVALSDSFIRRYTTPPSEYTRIDSRNYNETQKLYKLFAGKDQVIDPFGNKWERTIKDTCQRHVWERVNTKWSEFAFQ